MWLRLLALSKRILLLASLFYLGACGPGLSTSEDSTVGAFSILSAEGTTGKAVVLTWESAQGASSYKILRGTSPGNYTETVATNATSPYTDSGLSNGRTYYYTVVAASGATETYARSEIAATPSVTWSAIDGGDPLYGLNLSTSENEYPMGSYSLDGDLYVLTNEYPASNIRQIRMHRYDGTSWSIVPGPNSATSWNFDPTQSAYWPSRLYKFDDTVVMAWREFNWTGGAAGAQLRVSTYDGTTSTFIDGNANVGLNYAANVSVYGCQLAQHGTGLYVIWHENNQVRVKRYNGMTWSFIDGGAATGLNYDPSRGTWGGSMVSFDNQVWAAWGESDGSINQVRVRSYDGSSWTWRDGGGASGINIDTTKNMQDFRLFLYQSGLYVLLGEPGANGKIQLRLKKWNGTGWEIADGGSALNYSTSYDAYYSNVLAENDQLYIAWSEYDGSASRIRIKRFDGHQFFSLDGGSPIQINSVNGSFYPFLHFQNSDLILVFAASNGTKTQFRAMKMD